MKRLLCLVGLATLVACGGDSTAPDPNKAAVGTYSLTQVNGANVPMLYYQSADGRLDILSGSMALRSDQSYTQTLNLKVTLSDGSNQTTPILENGTFSVTGTQITFTIPASGGDPALSYTGAVSGGVVSYTYEGDSFRFQK